MPSDMVDGAARLTSTVNDARNDTGRIAFCGPVVVSAITGFSVSKVEDKIRAFRNLAPGARPVVRGTYAEEVAAALAHFDYTMEIKDSFMDRPRKERPTLSSWMENRRAGKEIRKPFSYYIVALHKKNEGHWVVVKGVHLCDTYSDGKWQLLCNCQHRGARVMEVFEVRRTLAF